MKKLAILISGQGSNMTSLVQACRQRAWPARIAAVISNRADAPGLLAAREAGVPTEVIAHRDHPSRENFDATLAARLEALEIDLVLLAGFMRILTDGFVQRFAGRLVNIHPSLLPAYAGLHTHRRALADGTRIHGCTVHFVTPDVDVGPIIAQAAVPVRDGDDEDTLAARVLAAEHVLLPAVVRWYCTGRLVQSGQRVRVTGADAASGATLFAPDPT